MTQDLRPPQAATFLEDNFGFGATRTLAKLRVKGGGPPFRKLGRLVVYDPADLADWAGSKLSGPRRSTSDGRRSSILAHAKDATAELTK